MNQVSLLLAAMLFLTGVSNSSAAQVERDDLQAELAALDRLMRASRMPAALEKVDLIVASPGFATLQEQQQFRVLVAGGSIAGSRRDYEKAHAFFKQATKFAMADANIFRARGDSARIVGDHLDAAESFMIAFEKWPDQWTKSDQNALFDISRRMFSTESVEAQYEFLNRLYSANFKVMPDEEPSGLWQEFVRLLLKNNENARASIVAGRVTNPYALLGMRIDREFDVLREVNPALLDVSGAAAKHVDQLARRAEVSPDEVQVQIAYLDALYTDGRYEAVVTAANPIIARAQSAEGRARLDMPDEVAWILDYMARALFALDRGGEAIEALVAARQIPEHGRDNVSHTINLAFAYCDTGQYREALDTLDLLGTPSPYGRMQGMIVRHCAARGLGNDEELQRTLEYVTEQKTDSPLDYLETLLLNDRLDEAANYLVGMLDAQERKTSALLRLQKFSVPAHLPESTRLIDGRLAEIALRPEVKAAIDRVGRIEEFSISRPLR